MSTISIEITDKEMRKSLRELSKYSELVTKGVQSAVVRSTFRAGGKARKNAPVKFGRLRQSIKEKISKMRGEISVNVNYAGAVEFGTKAHIIRPNKKKALAFRPGGGFRFWDESGRVVFKFVRHPGTKAQPYLRPAVQSEAKPFAKAIKKVIEESANKNK